MSKTTLATMLVIAALIGGGIATAVAAELGAFKGNTTTIVESGGASTSAGKSAAPTSLELAGPWNAIYSKSLNGIVTITDSPTEASVGSQGGGDLGTGVIVDGKGDIITAEHVVSAPGKLTVTLPNGSTLPARLLGSDTSSDVAVVKIDPSGLTLHPLALGDSSTLQVGDPIAVIGSPLGYSDSLSTGVVSGVDRTIKSPNGFTISHSLQTDAAMNPGNSGGPLLDGNGQVVGLADQIAVEGTGGTSQSTTDQSSGIGFAVPISLIKKELPTLELGKTPVHAYIGVYTSEATEGTGVIIAGVQAGTPAAKAGLKTGDIITAFNGSAVKTGNDLVSDLEQAAPGQKVTVTVLRGSKKITVNVTLGSQPVSAPAVG